MPTYGTFWHTDVHEQEQKQVLVNEHGGVIAFVDDSMSMLTTLAECKSQRSQELSILPKCSALNPPKGKAPVTCDLKRPMGRCASQVSR